ncbi:MAG: tetratricopeptide repeat protein [Opitutaceae bacterium]|nr:tetratricopeptide repeat protein [Opitutaceae bacterium]
MTPFEASLSIAIQNHRAGRHEDAFKLYRELLGTAPGDARANAQMGLLLHQHGAHAQAIEHFDISLRADETQPTVWTNRGEAARSLDRLDDAEACFRRALQHKPNCAITHNNLGLVLYRRGKLSEAEAAFRLSISAAPERPTTWVNLANVLRDWMRFDEAEAALRKAIEISPGEPAPRSNLIFLLGYRSEESPSEIYAEARQFGAPPDGAALPPLRPPQGNRRLRIGYLSPDFRSHPVATFVEPILAGNDSRRVEVFCYANVARPDAVTDRLRSRVSSWHSIYTLNDTAATSLIRSHELDVLVDLAGHTAGNRLGIFAQRAAPVQACYLGFFATTGLRTMDYWITDEVLHPPDYQDLFVEQLWKLPRCWLSYQAPADAPEPDVSIAPDSGATVFGSFNQILKVTSSTVRLWASVLRRVPDSRLLLKTRSLGDNETRSRVIALFKEEGIGSDRIDLLPAMPSRAEHLASYKRIDIALDTFPYSGGTTTCEALWMGVPVVTLAGGTMPSRMSTSILTAAGDAGGCARSPEEFVEIAVRLAGEHRSRNTEERRTFRRQQRERIAKSSLCDGRSLARALEDAYAQMVQEHLQRQ